MLRKLEVFIKLRLQPAVLNSITEGPYACLMLSLDDIDVDIDRKDGTWLHPFHSHMLACLALIRGSWHGMGPFVVAEQGSERAKKQTTTRQEHLDPQQQQQSTTPAATADNKNKPHSPSKKQTSQLTNKLTKYPANQLNNQPTIQPTN